MTDELTKTFFDTFGIEPKFGCKHLWNGGTIESVLTCLERCKNYCERDKCEQLVVIYPQITDRILLELIRIIGKKPFGYLQCENTYSTNLGDARDMITVEADSLKEGLLTLAMQNKVVLRIKRQVRTLFEES